MLSLKHKLPPLLSPLTHYHLSSSNSGSISPPHYLITTLLHFFSTNTSQPPPLIPQFLITSCGLPPDRAARAAKPIAHLRSLSKPESVLGFLRGHGFSPAQITVIISREPRLLVSSVPATLEPKMRALQAMGFSPPDLLRLVSETPSTLFICNLRPKIDFLRSLLGSDNNLLKACRRHVYLLTASLDATIIPNVSILRGCGISEHHIRTLIQRCPRFVTCRPERLKVLVERTEAMGVPHGSGMFWHTLMSTGCISQATFDAKLELLRSCGWSESEVMSAIRKIPMLLRLSEENICGTVEFLLKEASCSPLFIASHPVLLTYSLKKRLIPRCSVLRSLREKELRMGGRDLVSAIKITDEQFLNKFVLPHMDVLPELREAYVAACAGNVPTPVLV